MAKAKVIQPGLFTSIQDLGRFGYQSFGVPVSGVMDAYAMRMANMILGNNEDEAVLEITYQGPYLKFDSATSICITGADLSPTLNGKPAEQNEIIKIERDDELKFGRRRAGCRAYMAIRGGFKTENVLGSRSWYDGITSNSRLEKNMELPYEEMIPRELDTHAGLKIQSEYLSTRKISVFPGPEFERLSEANQASLFNDEFSIHSNSNRMAIQLQENFPNKLKPITTGPVLPGTVQLTPGGKLIILMKDCQTTGGYPRILQLSDSGLQYISQKIPGEKIIFEKREY